MRCWPRPVYSIRRDDAVYLHHMLDAANRAVQYTAGRTRDDLASDDLLALAVVRLIEILGEAARNVSEDIKVRHSQVPWRQVISTRNRLIHGYFDVDLDILWAIIENDLPKLVPQLEDILDER